MMRSQEVSKSGKQVLNRLSIKRALREKFYLIEKYAESLCINQYNHIYNRMKNGGYCTTPKIHTPPCN